MKNINFELVSPEEKLFSEPVGLAVIPGEEGEMGVAAGHASLVVALKPGVVSLHKEMGEAPYQRIFIAGGFADVTSQNCVVLAEQAVNVNELNQVAIEQELKDLRVDLGLAKDHIEKTRVEKRILLTQAKLRAVTGKTVI